MVEFYLDTTLVKVIEAKQIVEPDLRKLAAFSIPVEALVPIVMTTTYFSH